MKITNLQTTAKAAGHSKPAAAITGGGSENLIVDNKPIGLNILQDPINDENKTPCLSAGSPTGQTALGVATEYIVRRLTPLECERLQGFPDGWTQIGAPVDVTVYRAKDENGNIIAEFPDVVYEYTDENGKKHKTTDSARYKALGNSIAIPPWTYVLQRLSACCANEPTMASLFDGIGGFPLIWEHINGKGSCLWASEIEDFPIAVTKFHFPEEGANNG